MSTAIIDGVRFKHDLPPSALSEAMEAIHDAQAVTNPPVAGLVKSIKAKDSVAESHFRDQLFTVYEPRLASAIAANKKLPPHKRGLLEDCFTIASELDLDKSLKESFAIAAYGLQ